MKKIVLITGVLSTTMFFSGCSGLISSSEPPKAFKGAVSNTPELSIQEQYKLLNKSLNQVSKIAQSSAKISLSPSPDNCFVWGVVQRNSSKRGEMTSCYKIEGKEIALKQDFKCFAREKNRDVGEIHDCSFGIVSHTDRYVKFIDTISKYIVTAYNENLKAIEEAPQRAAKEEEEYKKTLEEIITKSYAELEGQAVNIVNSDEFGNKKIEQSCKVQIKYNLAIVKNKYEPIELFKKEFSNTVFSFADVVEDKTHKEKTWIDQTKRQASFAYLDGIVRGLVSRGQIPPTFNIEVASKTGIYSMSASESAVNVLSNVTDYMYDANDMRTKMNRVLLLDAFLISTGMYHPKAGANCTISINRQQDIEFLYLLKNKNPKALKLYGVMRNRDNEATATYLLNNREVAEIFAKIKETMKGL